MSAGPDLLGVKRYAFVLAIAAVLLSACGGAGAYDEEACDLLAVKSRKWAEFDLRQKHDLDQYESVDAVDHAIREYCPGVRLR